MTVCRETGAEPLPLHVVMFLPLSLESGIGGCARFTGEVLLEARAIGIADRSMLNDHRSTVVMIYATR